MAPCHEIPQRALAIDKGDSSHFNRPTLNSDRDQLAVVVQGLFFPGTVVPARLAPGIDAIELLVDVLDGEEEGHDRTFSHKWMT